MVWSSGSGGHPNNINMMKWQQPVFQCGAQAPTPAGGPMSPIMVETLHAGNATAQPLTPAAMYPQAVRQRSYSPSPARMQVSPMVTNGEMAPRTQVSPMVTNGEMAPRTQARPIHVLGGSMGVPLGATVRGSSLGPTTQPVAVKPAPSGGTGPVSVVSQSPQLASSLAPPSATANTVLQRPAGVYAANGVSKVQTQGIAKSNMSTGMRSPAAQQDTILHDKEIATLNATLAQRETQIQELERELAARNGQIAELTRQNEELRSLERPQVVPVTTSYAQPLTTYGQRLVGSIKSEGPWASLTANGPRVSVASEGPRVSVASEGPRVSVVSEVQKQATQVVGSYSSEVQTQATRVIGTYSPEVQTQATRVIGSYSAEVPANSAPQTSLVAGAGISISPEVVPSSTPITSVSLDQRASINSAAEAGISEPNSSISGSGPEASQPVQVPLLRLLGQSSNQSTVNGVATEATVPEPEVAASNAPLPVPDEPEDKATVQETLPPARKRPASSKPPKAGAKKATAPTSSPTPAPREDVKENTVSAGVSVDEDADDIDIKLQQYFEEYPDFSMEVTKIKNGWYQFGKPVAKKIYMKKTGMDKVVCRINGGFKPLTKFLDDFRTSSK